MSGSAHQGGGDLVIPADTPVHRMAPAPKIVATVLFIVAVAFTPSRIFWPFLWYAFVLAVAVALARLPILTLVRRLVVEVPFLLFTVLLPFTGGGPEIRVLGLPLSLNGLQAAAMIILKATFGLLATGVLAATTSLPEIITGFEQLRMPRVLTVIASFMVRYLELLVAELNRLRTARACRGGNPRWLWHVKDVAGCLGAMFLRTLERGERVHVAMLSRGFDGRLPPASTGTLPAVRVWLAAAILPALAGAGSITAAVMT
ncbi:cobalt ECF transporter T component CbiQ [Amycolatopsis sp. MtRt-6]|uniref:cobalt ECF transporter T component CbiQ n=1 Tax=Amycolatopsis sp. MtRt-6 TaxID=2792782 RepID=UPI001A8DCEC1|nr:cobalt ECF transporter T component CbiQ [Amycolatopsis sp. MtRt-6]